MEMCVFNVMLCMQNAPFEGWVMEFFFLVITVCIGHNWQGFGSGGAAGVTCVGGGHGLPCASHSCFQLAWQWMTLTHCAPKLQPIRGACSASTQTYLRKGGTNQAKEAQKEMKEEIRL